MAQQLYNSLSSNLAKQLKKKGNEALLKITFFFFIIETPHLKTGFFLLNEEEEAGKEC